MAAKALNLQEQAELKCMMTGSAIFGNRWLKMGFKSSNTFSKTEVSMPLSIEIETTHSLESVVQDGLSKLNQH